MPTAFRICKVCGNKYPYCKTVMKDDVFRWQDVACCPEHGIEYFKLVEKSRSNGTSETKKETPPIKNASSANDISDSEIDIDEELEEEEDEDDFENEDEEEDE